MKKSPVYPKYEGDDYGVGYEFDPQVDFSQFLEEARQHARATNLQNSAAESEAENRRSEEEKKPTKSSWKKSLFKWWKSDTKKSDQATSSTSRESENNSHISRPRNKGHVSGPVYGTGCRRVTKHWRQISGPLTSLFNPIKRMGKETPYMNLDQQNNPDGVVKPYGTFSWPLTDECFYCGPGLV